MHEPISKSPLHQLTMRAGRKARATGRTAAARCDERLLANIALRLCVFSCSFYCFLRDDGHVGHRSSMACMGATNSRTSEGERVRSSEQCLFVWSGPERVLAPALQKAAFMRARVA